MIAVEKAITKELQYKVSWEIELDALNTTLVSLTINSYQLDVLGQILSDNNIKGFGVEVIK